MKFTDFATLGGDIRETRDGFLVGTAKASRTGIQRYLGSEVGQPDREFVDVYRPPEEVFSADSLRSFMGKPMTVTHPDEIVTRDNWKKYAVGTIDRANKDEDDPQSVRLSFALMDAAAIETVTTDDDSEGMRQLSVGYRSELDFTPGTTPEGENYDAIQRNIFVDHLAIVKAGRAGPQYRIGDDAKSWGATPVHDHKAKESEMSDNKTPVLVVVGDEAINTDAAGKSAIDRLKADMKAKEDAFMKEKADMKAKLDEMEKEGSTKDGKITALEKQLEDAKLTPDQISELVKDRNTLIDKAKAFGVTDGLDAMSDMDIRRAALCKVFDAEKVKAMKDEAATACFDIYEVKSQDNALAALASGPIASMNATRDASNKAYQERIADMQNAWKTEGGNA